MYFENAAIQLVKKVESFYQRQKLIDFFYRLDIIYKINQNDSNTNDGEVKDLKFAVDQKTKISMYLSKLVPNSYKENELFKPGIKYTTRLENIREEVGGDEIKDCVNPLIDPSNAYKFKNISTIKPRVGFDTRNENLKMNNFMKTETPLEYPIIECTSNPNMVSNQRNRQETNIVTETYINDLSSPQKRNINSSLLSIENMNQKEMFHHNNKRVNGMLVAAPGTPDRRISNAGNINISKSSPEKEQKKRRSESKQVSRVIQPGVFLSNSKSKTKLLRIGDIVLMRYNFKMKNSKDAIDAILCPEKIISKQLLCIPFQKIEESENVKSIFKRALFRIENPQSYLYQYQLESAKKSLKNKQHSEETIIIKRNTSAIDRIDELIKLAYEEKKGNESEFHLNYSNEVTYGQMVQFRNVFTNEVLIVDLNNISKEIGCLDLSLSHLGGQIAWFKLMPSHKIRSEGDCVSYLDNFYIVPVCVDSESFMHVNFNEDEKIVATMDVNISSRMSIFKMSLFESAEEVRKGKLKNVIKSTDAVKLYNKDAGGYLTVCFKTNSMMLAALKTDKRFHGENESMESNETENKIIDNAYKRANNYLIFLDTDKERGEECNTYWEIQYEKPYEGHAITCGLSVRFRHIPSGFYLSFNSMSNQIGLSLILDQSTLFTIYSDNQDDNLKETYIYNSSQIYLCAWDTDSYLKVNTEKCIESKYFMTLSKEDKMEYSKMVFKIEAINYSLVKINYNIALAIVHLRNIYEIINDWGMRSGCDESENNNDMNGCFYDYFIAAENEQTLANQISLYMKILTSLKEEAIENKPESVHYRKFQNFHAEQGLITILLNFVTLFDSKAVMQKEEGHDFNFGMVLKQRDNIGTNIMHGLKQLNSPEKIALKYTEKAMELTYDMIHLLLSDNQKTSQTIYNSLPLIGMQFDYHKLDVLKILISCIQARQVSSNQNSKTKDQAAVTLTNNSQRLNNMYTQISFWKNKIKDIDENENNLEEQKLFIQVIKFLSLDSMGNGIYTSQIEIKILLFSNDIIPLKFGMEDIRPYVIFNTQLSFDDFFKVNPSLLEIRCEKNGFKDTPLFYLEKFSLKFSKFVDYICSVLDLYQAACVDRNQANLHIISNSKHVGLSLFHIWKVIMDNNISMKIRIRYIKLLRTLYLDVDPNMRISKFRLKVFFWTEKRDEEDIVRRMYKWYRNSFSDDMNPNYEKQEFKFLKIYITDFWEKINMIERTVNASSFDEVSQNKEVFTGVLEYINEIFNITKEMIDFGYFTLKEINEILIGIAYFFSIFEKYKPRTEEELAQDYLINQKNKPDYNKARSSHWLAELAFECLESEHSEIKALLFKLYESCIEILNVICMIKEDIQIENFLSVFSHWYNEGNSLADTNEMIRVYYIISNSMSMLNFEIEDNDSLINMSQSSKKKEKMEDHFQKGLIEDIKINDNFHNEQVPVFTNEVNYNNINNIIIHKKDDVKTLLPLDMYLLGVLFNDYDNEFSDKSLDNKSLTLLIRYFNEYENLKHELTTVEIIVNQEDLNNFNHLSTANQRLRELGKLLIEDYAVFNITKNLEKQGNLNRIQDLVRNIENDLIGILNLKALKKLSKLQNLCRHLQIHENAIELMQFLLNFDTGLPLYHSIFKFLFHFCYRNYHNQMSLKKYFNSFLQIIGEYDYLCEVLTEILNLYKETPKIKKFIDRIFAKITKDDEISSETIDVLRSLTMNYKEENISFNQGIIIKYFLYHSKFLRFFFKEEEKKELEGILMNIKEKPNKSGKTYKKLITQIKFIELLSACARGNSFCVLNCRRLVKIEDAVRFLLSNEVPYIMKPAYLEFLYLVFYVDLDKNCQAFPIVHALEIVKELILPELGIFYFHSVYFRDIFISKTTEGGTNELKESQKHALNELKEITNKRIRDDDSIREYLQTDFIDFDLLETRSMFNAKKFVTENKKTEYWKFLLSDTHNYNLKSQGVLIFIYDLFTFVQSKHIEFQTHDFEVILQLKKKLNEMIDYLTIIEEKLGEKEEITELEYAIQRCIGALPKTRYNKIIKKLAGGVTQAENPIVLHMPINLTDIDKFDEPLEKKEKIERNAIKVLKFIQEFLVVNETNITGIFNMLDTDNDKQIGKFEFKRNLKLLLCDRVTNEEIEDAMNYIDTNGDEKISMKELSSKLSQISKENQLRKKFVLTNFQDIKLYLDLETKLDDKSYKITSVFKHFILAFHEIQERVRTNSEISDLVKKLDTFINNNYDNAQESLKKFIESLQMSFHRKKNIIHLLKIMSELINNRILQVEQDSPVKDSSTERTRDKDKYAMIRKIQNQLNYSGVTDISMGLIEKTNSPEVIEESLNLLTLLLKNGNNVVQQTVFNYLSNPINTFNFLSYVREILHFTAQSLRTKLLIKENENSEGKKMSSFYSELEKYYHKPIDLSHVDIFYNDSMIQIEKKIFYQDPKKNFRIPKKILQLLQLFCENCFESFQHFLREQDYYVEDKDKVSSINIVYEVGNFLITLLNFSNSIYTDNETLKLINQSFLTLAAFCLGPCKENQILLGSRRTLFKMFNTLLRNDYNFNIKEQTHRKKNMLLCQAILFLKTLINRETLKEVGETLLDELDIYLLIEKLIDIHEMKINPNLSNIYSGKYCNHKDKFSKILKQINNEKKNTNTNYRQCSNIDCVQGYISETDLKYITTGFDIFIILTYLRDIFPNHQKLNMFKFKINSDIFQTFLNEENTKLNNKKRRESNRMLRSVQTELSMFTSNTSFQSQISGSKLNGESRAGDLSMKTKTLNINSPSLSSFSGWTHLHQREINERSCMNCCLRFICCCCKRKMKSRFGDNSAQYETIPGNESEMKKTTVGGERFFNKTHRENLIKKVDKMEFDLKKRFFNKYREYFSDTYIFFAQNISNVEIFYRDEIVKTYFKIPFIFKFLPDDIKSSIIWDTKYNNHQARLEEFFKQIGHVKKGLVHQQKLNKFRMLVNSWKILSHISFVLSIIINFLLIIFIQSGDLENCYKGDCVFIGKGSTTELVYSLPVLSHLMFSLQAIQIVVNLFAIVFFIINQYPVINSKLEKRANELNLFFNERKIKKYSGSILFYFLYEFIDKISENNQNILVKLFYVKGFNLLLDPQVIVFFLYLLVSITGILFSPLINTVILFDIIRRSNYLLDVFEAIKINFTQLVQTVILLFIILYSYSIILFYNLRTYFVSSDYMPNGTTSINMYCDTLYQCFLTILHVGITSKEGLASVARDLPRSNSDYWKKVIIDITFFFICMTLLMNIIFSVIIDSFRELRDKLKSKEKLIKEFCFVCGIPKYYFEIKGNGWVSHYKYEHNVFAYLYYVIELEQKEMNQCDGLEKYVKICIANADYKFLPLNQALSLHEKQVEINDESLKFEEKQFIFN